MNSAIETSPATHSNAPSRRGYVMERLGQFARELNPLHWPIGAAVVLGDTARVCTRLPVTPHTHAKVDVPTPAALEAVMGWLASAQDANRDGGVPAYYALYGGFGSSYPETTGYIIPTLLDYAARRGNTEFVDRAVRAGQWLLSLQTDSGAFPGGLARSFDGPSVFNSGQIIFGLVALARQTGDDKIAQAAMRAGQWLAEVQSDDGAWRQHTYEGRSHVYYTMVAWALAELHAFTGEELFAATARRNLAWALSQQGQRGWFDGYNLGRRPIFLHFIAYTLQGLIEAGRLLDDCAAIEATLEPAEILLRKFEIRKWLPGAFNEGWKSDARYGCLTGNAQMSITWQLLAEHTADLRFLNAALKINELIKSTISLRGPRGLRGAVKGSHPTWGKYLFLRYPNWAAKFTADALMRELAGIARLNDKMVPCES